MPYSPIMTEERLDARSSYMEMRSVIPELLLHLITSSATRLDDIRIPFSGSIGQHSWDGIVVSPEGPPPYVPQGRSCWEIGTGGDAHAKATEVFRTRTDATQPDERAATTFVFVTSRSAVHGWSADKQEIWIDQRKAEGWKGIRILDGSKLTQWICLFPSVDMWLATQCDVPTRGLAPPLVHWNVLKTYGQPPDLKPSVFLASRKAAAEELRKLFRRETRELAFETRYPDEVVDFVVAAVMSFDLREQSAYGSRCMIMNDPDTWKTMSLALKDPHVFVPTASLDVADSEAELRRYALAHGHAVVFPRGSGSGHGNVVRLAHAKPHELKDALMECGYAEHKARLVSERCNGRIAVLKRLLQDVSASPSWAAGTEAAMLALANLVGAWDGNSQGDRDLVEDCVGKTYGEWIGVLRPLTLRPDPPLIQRDEKWKFVSRFEGWQTLAQHLADADLDRFHKSVFNLLREPDPSLELPPEDRWRAGTLGKASKCSHRLREGMAETLALIGSHPEALSSCSAGRSAGVVAVVVREILRDADWKLWGSLNDILPLLAEAAPEQFLDAVESAVRHTTESPFRTLFGQETSGIAGRNYVTGVLWALETLAWNADYLTRATVALGALAEMDPGGKWSNRPASSLVTIFLPWFPQTCAPLARRKTAIETLLREHPQAGWQLLMGLLPRYHSMSSGSHKPRWRDFIPEDYKGKLTHREYHEQVDLYAELTVVAAGTDPKRLTILTEDIDGLPPEPRRRVLTHLSSEQIAHLGEVERVFLWEALVELVAKHRKHATADWALRPESVQELDRVAAALRPQSPRLLHRRLFTDRDFELYEEKGNYETQRKELQSRRNAAATELLAQGGVTGICSFARTVAAPWQVGYAVGSVALADADPSILPALLGESDALLARFAAGFVWGRHHVKGWPWLDGLPMAGWTPEQKAALFALLPFARDTWSRLERVFGSDQSLYWAKANVNPYEPRESLAQAVEPLLKSGRARAAVQCLARLAEDKAPLNADLVLRALHANLDSEEPVGTFDQDSALNLIKWLQDQPDVSTEELFRIEWRYLPLLDRLHGGRPKLMEERLASDPAFFCEVIGLVFRSAKERGKPKETNEQGKRLAENAYQLLHAWQVVPGKKADGPFDATAFRAWLESVKTITRESGHYEIAMSQVGQVLPYSPKDPDGLWIHKAVAEALNAPDAGEMRSGFTVELFNSRGVHSFTHGREEKEHAVKYRKMADDLDAAGFQRFAASLRGLAASYERDAQRDENRDPFDE